MRFAVLLCALGLVACAGGGTAEPSAPAAAPAAPAALLSDIHRRTFDYFWQTTDAATGLVRDRYPADSPSSIAAIGFGLTSYGIGAERGYITRQQAAQRVLTTLRFLAALPQGPEPTGRAGYRGFFYHFLDIPSGLRTGTNELSTVDTTLLMAGVLFCREYFDGQSAEEAQIRKLADELYRRVEWTWAQARPPAIALGWHPETGFIAYDWRGYNEAILVYVLALGSPTHPISVDAWREWAASYDKSWGTLHGQSHLTFGPLFGHQYSHIWLDLRGIRDRELGERRGLDYFENSRRAVYSQRAYAIANPLGWRDYSENVWGLTASDGPIDLDLPYRGELRRFRTYAARGVSLDPAHNYDDGTIAPTAALGSLPFAPEIVIPAVTEMHRRYGHEIYGKYGFFDAFNPSFDYPVPLRHGRLAPGLGWVDTDYLGIDQGPIITMIENHETELVWRVMRRNPYVRKGLERAGFTGGWLRE